MSCRYVNIFIRLRTRYMKLHGKIIPYADDNISVPNLWNAILLGFIQMNRQLIAALFHISKNLFEIIGSSSANTRDILCDKPEWVKRAKNFDSIPVKPSELLILHTLMLADT